MVNNRLTMVRGDTTSYVAVIKTASDSLFEDIDTYTSTMTIKKDKESNTIYAQITGTVVDVNEAKIKFSFSATDTNIEPGIYYYDIQLTKGDEKYTPIIDTIEVIRDVNEN